MQQSDDQKTGKDETDFTKAQSDLDKAKNEFVNDESKNNQNGNKDELITKTDTPRKKTGGGKQVNPGM